MHIRETMKYPVLVDLQEPYQATCGFIIWILSVSQCEINWVSRRSPLCIPYIHSDARI